MRDAYINALYELAEQNEKIYCVIADIGIYIFDRFKESFPERFFNFGIAEQNLIGAATGMALCGKIPFAYSIIPFVTVRCLDQIRVNVCYQNLNVKIVGVGSGFAYGILGATHHAIDDIAMMRALPNMSVICPADSLESAKATKAAAEHEGPVYIRLGRTALGHLGAPIIYHQDYEYEIGNAILVRDGNDATIIASGGIVSSGLKAAEELSREGINTRVINMHTVKPIDRDIILKAAEETKAIVTLEEHNIIGGLGSAVAEVLAEEAQGKVPFSRIGVRDEFCRVAGAHAYLLDEYGMSVSSIVKSIKELVS